MPEFDKSDYAILAVLILTALSILCVVATITDDNKDYPEASHQVMRGETLWDIARKHRPCADPREVIWAIRSHDPSIDPGRLVVGQIITIP